ncbi:DsbA family oxidoreductase [Microbacterium sp. YY-01]|uniref:DsbA family oxidoreductase n=1 Tax=Microbacterium sp. YY-01 TaxID=3421634 RepID=UPI003D176C0A
MTKPISIDIWSDIACPWCYIGKRNLEKGLAALTGDDAPEVAITYHSFELSPDTPVDFDGDEIDFLVDHKGMAREQVEKMLAHVTGVAAQAGLTYNFDKLQHTNTVKAHELLHFALQHGKQHEMKERLLRAYFSEGEHIGRIDSLAQLAGSVGLDPDAARQALMAGEFTEAVRADQEQARAYGIQGVPFFVIDGKYGISGAQPAEAFENVLRDLWSKRDEETPLQPEV